MDKEEILKYIDELISNVRISKTDFEPKEQIKAQILDGKIEFTNKEKNKEMDYLPTTDDVRYLIKWSDIERLKKKSEDEEGE